jgi:thioredoxin:protein disulfide reductase
MGWVLVGMAVYFIRPVLPEAFKILLPVAVALAAGLHLGWLDKNQIRLQGFCMAQNQRRDCVPGAGNLLDDLMGRAGPGGGLATYSDALVQQAVRKKTGHHRFLCRLVRAMP